jgi:hypothetical protein
MILTKISIIECVFLHKSAGVNGAICQSDLDVGQEVGRIHGLGSCAFDLGSGIGGDVGR